MSPRLTSERRRYVPVVFIDAGTLANDQCFVIAYCGLFEFDVVCSQPHNAWMRQTCSRLESRFRYSNTIVYNNFPWPDIGLSSTAPSPQPSPARGRGGETERVVAKADATLTKEDAARTKLRAAIESAAQGVLDARAAHRESSLADLYDPVTMPPDLTKTHQKLDAAVDAAYFAAHAADGAKKSWRNDAQRVAFLFTLYPKFTSLMPVDSAKPKRAKARR